MHNNRKEIEQAIKERARHRRGRHIVVSADGLQAGQKTDRKGKEYNSLTKAKKIQQSGEAIVRCVSNNKLKGCCAPTSHRRHRIDGDRAGSLAW